MSDSMRVALILIGTVTFLIAGVYVFEIKHDEVRRECESRGGVLVTRDWLCVKRDSVLR